jgi:anti-sigma regulatory factor (Ser/Thr protein kinase)
VDASALQIGSSAWCTEIAGGPAAACTARELLTQRFGDITPEVTMHDLHLLATELITNSVLHAGVDESDTVELRVASSRAGLRVWITDPGADTVPEVQELDPTVPGGMGLFLVDQISTRWGIERTARGENRVWFELAA